MKHSISIVLIALAAVLFSVSDGSAKGPVDLIIISGGGLAHPIEVTDSVTRSVFSPWTGGFIDFRPPLAYASSEARCKTSPYDVRFYLRGAGRHSIYDIGELALIYAVAYCAEPGHEWVRLPGRGESLYEINIGTIIRDKMDGHAFKASALWNARFASLVRR